MENIIQIIYYIYFIPSLGCFQNEDRSSQIIADRTADEMTKHKVAVFERVIERSQSTTSQSPDHGLVRNATSVPRQPSTRHRLRSSTRSHQVERERERERESERERVRE